MEWDEAGERSGFAQTAAKFANWIRKNVPAQPDLQPAVADQFNKEIIKQADEAGILNAPLPERFGGVGLDAPARAMVLEKIAGARAGIAMILVSHWAGLGALTSLVNDPRVSSWLSESASRKSDLLYGVAVPVAAFDSEQGIPAQAQESGGKRKLSGDFICLIHPLLVKRLVIAMPEEKGSGRLLCLAGKDLAGFCQDEFPGAGLEEAPITRLAIREFEVPDDAILVEGGPGLERVNVIWYELYLGLSGAMIGNAVSAKDAAWDYANQRIQTGRLIIEHQEVRRMLEEMNIMAEAAWGMLVSAAGMADPKMALGRMRRAFIFSGSACEKICLDAIQVLGGYGYMEDYGLERRLRDLKSIQCLLGSYPLEWIGENI